jgi:hypothetical protein
MGKGKAAPYSYDKMRAGCLLVLGCKELRLPLLPRIRGEKTASSCSWDRKREGCLLFLGLEESRLPPVHG